MAILLKSVLYDDGRHFFFIYPFFIIIMIFGWLYIKGVSQKYFSLKSLHYYGISILFLIPLVFKMYSLHPFQYMYFNAFAPKDIEKKFELDYYGISYKKGLDYLLENQEPPFSIVMRDSFFYPSFCNALLFKHEDFSKFNYVKKREDANFFITSYRATKDRNAYLKSWNIKQEWEVYSVEVEGNKILSVFELPKD